MIVPTSVAHEKDFLFCSLLLYFFVPKIWDTFWYMGHAQIIFVSPLGDTISPYVDSRFLTSEVVLSALLLMSSWALFPYSTTPSSISCTCFSLSTHTFPLVLNLVEITYISYMKLNKPGWLISFQIKELLLSHKNDGKILFLWQHGWIFRSLGWVK